MGGVLVNLTVDLDGGTNNVTIKNQYYTADVLQLDTPTKDNYVFTGWKLVSGDAVLSGNKLTFGLEDVSIIALWTKSLYEFAYTGSEQTFIAPASGNYKLEVWGAQGHSWSGACGSSSGGAGGYSSGYVYLNKGKKLYLNIGGYGENENVYGTGAGPGGGGATSISFISGKLQTLENSINSILIVSGGGGGSEWCKSDGGSGGGYKGGTAVNLYISEGLIYGGTQSSGGASAPISQYSGTANIYNGSFGQGGYTIGGDGGGQGGNGFYGGGASDYGYGGGGGSGYIGNSLLTNKVMYCYNCDESSDESTKTISTTCTNATATENCAKKGAGYVKITYIG